MAKATNLPAQDATKMTTLLPASVKRNACHPLQSLRAHAGRSGSTRGFRRTIGSFCYTSGRAVARTLTARRAPDLANWATLPRAAGSCSSQESHSALDIGHDVALPRGLCCAQDWRRAVSTSNSSLCYCTYSYKSCWRCSCPRTCLMRFRPSVRSQCNFPRARGKKSGRLSSAIETCSRTWRHAPP